jgi:hypothetical protein
MHVIKRFVQNFGPGFEAEVLFKQVFSLTGELNKKQTRLNIIHNYKAISYIMHHKQILILGNRIRSLKHLNTHRMLLRVKEY